MKRAALPALLLALFLSPLSILPAAEPAPVAPPSVAASDGKTELPAKPEAAEGKPEATSSALFPTKLPMLPEAEKGFGLARVFPLLKDSDHLLPTDVALALEQRLDDFDRTGRHRVVVQLAAHAPPDTDGRKINAHVETLATSLGLAKDGVLVFYSADRDEWKLWLGDALLPAVMGRPGTAADFTPDGALHARKDALLAPAAKISADKTQPADRRLALASDALLSTLLPALEKK